MIGLLVFILFACSVPSPPIQEKNFWQVLAEVRLKKEKKGGYEMEVPLFTDHLKSWNGKKISLKGFVIPAGEVGDESKFMLSSLPFNVCYFCGAAGPEPITEGESTEKVKFTSQAIWMEGVLQLNEKDPDRHIYFLKSAKVITP